MENKLLETIHSLQKDNSFLLEENRKLRKSLEDKSNNTYNTSYSFYEAKMEKDFLISNKAIRIPYRRYQSKI